MGLVPKPTLHPPLWSSCSYSSEDRVGYQGLVLAEGFPLRVCTSLVPSAAASSLQPPESPKIVEWQCRSRMTSEGVAGQGS